MAAKSTDQSVRRQPGKKSRSSGKARGGDALADQMVLASSEDGGSQRLSDAYPDSIANFAKWGPNMSAADTELGGLRAQYSTLLLLVDLYERACGRNPPPQRLTKAEEISGCTGGDITYNNGFYRGIEPYAPKTRDKADADASSSKQK